MNEYLLKARIWFETRSIREKLFVLLLSWALIYAFTNFLFINVEEHRTAVLRAEIKEIEHRINAWKTQINALNKLAESDLYKKWLLQHQAFSSLRGQYKFLQNASPTKQWQDVIRAVLQSQNNITLLKIKNFPESSYTTSSTGPTEPAAPAAKPSSTNNIFQQRLLLAVSSDYFGTLNYLKRLEDLLPNIRWDLLSYEVFQYPFAKVEMEFSILYEKNE
ncbi:MAG: hypothetical protein H0W64_08380 [Gammaproteobacteria bacterium]|nr:hypothetical protein [Gammaproteobacteria bacterium]